MLRDVNTPLARNAYNRIVQSEMLSELISLLDSCFNVTVCLVPARMDNSHVARNVPISVTMSGDESEFLLCLGS